MIWLTISIIALGLGVSTSALLQRQSTWRATLQGFVIGFIGMLLFVEILPHTQEHIGLWSWAWFALGFVLITGIDYFSGQRKAWLSMGLLSLVFGLHALVDGVALGTQRDGTMLAIAIVAHRFPEGLAIAGKTNANLEKWLLFGVMTVASVAGYFSVQRVPFESLSILQALAGGGLAHVLLHAQLHGHQHTIEDCNHYDLRSWRIGGFFSSLLAYMLIGFIHSSPVHSSHIHTHEANISLMTLVAMALFGLVWFEKKHAHH